MSEEKRVNLDFTVISRSAFPDAQAEGISREMDFSPKRIQELLWQGYREAKAKL
jgi:hypothetical protein